MTDAKGEEEVRQRALFAGFYGIDDVSCALLAHTFQIFQTIGRQGIEVGVIVHKTDLHEFPDELRAQVLDIHGVARSEVDKAVFHHRGTGGVHAPDIHFRFEANKRGAANRAVFGKPHRLRIGRAFFQLYFHHLGDDLAALLDDNRIARTDVLAGDFLLVMERGSADGGSFRTKLGRCVWGSCDYRTIPDL